MPPPASRAEQRREKRWVARGLGKRPRAPQHARTASASDWRPARRRIASAAAIPHATARQPERPESPAASRAYPAYGQFSSGAVPRRRPGDQPCLTRRSGEYVARSGRGAPRLAPPAPVGDTPLVRPARGLRGSRAG